MSAERGRVTLSIPGTPPSMNKVGLRSHWAVGRAEKQRWQGFFAIALLEQRTPKRLKFVHASATLRFKQRRRRDEGNHRMLAEKALGDALVAGGYLPDDDAELYRFGRVEFMAPCERPETIVVLDYVR